MKNIYVLIKNDYNCEIGEKIKIYLNLEDAIKASKIHKEAYVEIFEKSIYSEDYVTTYCYYKNGEYVDI